MRLAPEASLERHIRLVGTRNLRDVGGYPTADGRVTRWRTLLRADCLDRLTLEAQATLLDQGVRQVIDLRRTDELESHPNVFRESPRVRYRHVNMVPAPGPGTIAETYRAMLDGSGPQITSVFRAVLEPGALPAIVHCAAGKDRTGVVIGLLLAAVGVPPDVIVEDYGLTKQCYATPFERIDADGVGQGMVEEEAPVVDCPPEAMVETLDHLEKRYGGIEGYLARHGITRDEVERLRRLLTEPADGVADRG